ncbi:hypothetical protein PR048_022819 [Dryococelus australis]|uniref:Transposase n=1 Tax=Dryococelus australis TaxID=614101 RepID=A0ABQ9GSG3_9NEOP|nr:hypothetical protein PR048_022819 [Dryococelus australis]
MGTSNSRTSEFYRDMVEVFYNNLGELLDNHQYPTDRAFNVDETGLSITQSNNPHAIGHKGKRQIGVPTAAE